MQVFLKNMLKRIVGVGRDQAASPPLRALPLKDVDDNDIPRYPPFAKGLPVASVDRVLATQVELIERIRVALGISAKDFDELLLPVFRNYAAFVHLLPASEAHHHRGAGGLFRHGLEAAFGAAQASGGVIFSIAGTPKEKRDNEPRWRLASTLAGLLHDVGKPLSDMSVSNEKGTTTWNPYSEFLFEWASRNSVDRYFLRWRDNRFKRHERFSLLAVDRIIPVKTQEFITQPGPLIMEALLEAVSGTSINNPVTKLMMFADKESVKSDLKQSRLNVDEFAYGVPVERYVFDAIRRLVNSGKWAVNEKGAKVWHLHQGVFIAWRSLGDLHEIIDQDKIPGIPRDPDTLADILIERGFAIQNKVTNGNEEELYRYWEVQPDGIPVKVLMLRFSSHELVFTNEPPPPIAGVISNEDEADLEGLIESADLSEDDNTDSSDQVPSIEATERTTAVASEVDGLLGDIGFSSVFGESEPVPVDEPAPEPEPEPEPAPEPEPVLAAEVKAETPAEAEIVATEQSTTPEIPQEMPQHAEASANRGSKPQKVAHVKHKTLDMLPGKPAPMGAPPTTKEQGNDAGANDNPKAVLLARLDKLGDAGVMLKDAMLPILEGKVDLGSPIGIVGGQVIIPFPLGVKSMGNQGSVINSLFDSGALQTNPVMPGKKVHDIAGIKCLTLDRDISDAFKDACKELGISQARQPQVRNHRPNRAKPHKDTPTKEVKSSLKTLDGMPAIKKQNTTTSIPLARKSEFVADEQTDTPAKPKKRIYEPMDVEIKTIQQDSEDDDFVSSVSQADRIVKDLIEMVISGDGRWLATPVTINEQGFRVTSDQALDQIIMEHPAFSRVSLRRLLIPHKFYFHEKKMTYKPQS